jgi:hypothetical protein
MIFKFFHFDKPDKRDKELQPKKNILLILLALGIFHFEISVKEFNELQQENIQLILVTLSVFHLEISGKDNKEE